MLLNHSFKVFSFSLKMFKIDAMDGYTLFSWFDMSFFEHTDVLSMETPVSRFIDCNLYPAIVLRVLEALLT